MMLRISVLLSLAGFIGITTTASFPEPYNYAASILLGLLLANYVDDIAEIIKGRHQ